VLPSAGWRKTSSLRILYIAYPLLPVTQESCGGAEQVLWTLEAEIAGRGHETVVAACEGSRIAGQLFATGPATKQPDRFEQRNAEHVQRILAAVGSRSPSRGTPEQWLPKLLGRFDLVHDHSGSFWQHAREVDVPVLATLHLPRAFYRADAFDSLPRNLHFVCVSDSQRKNFSALSATVVRNGIRVPKFPGPDHYAREEYLLWLGRICEEKGAHVAIGVAREAGKKLIIAGDVYPFSYHQQYFAREIEPQIGDQVSFVRTPSFADKIDLLRRASALLLPSLVDETSSLVAMEAMACGTPVIAFRRGAIPEVVRDGITGFIVTTVDEMASAVTRVAEIDPTSCRRHVEENFSADRMADDYERLYREVIEEGGASRQMRAA